MPNWDEGEIASTLGAFDSDTFADGRAVDASIVHGMTTIANRQLGKAQHIASLQWPNAGAPDDQDGYSVWCTTWPLSWARVLPRFPLRYRRGLNTFSVYIDVRLQDDDIVEFQFATSACPFDRTATSTGQNTIQCIGDNSGIFQQFDKQGMWMDPGGVDWFDIRVAAASSTSRPADPAYGPTVWTDVTTAFAAANGSWVYTDGTFTNPGFFNVGTEIQLLDPNTSAPIGNRHIITGQTSTTLYVAPNITAPELAAWDQFPLQTRWALYQLPTIGLGTITIVGEERTL